MNLDGTSMLFLDRNDRKREKVPSTYRLEFPEEEMADFQYNGSPSLPKKFIFLDLGYVLLLLLQHQLLL